MYRVQQINYTFRNVFPMEWNSDLLNTLQGTAHMQSKCLYEIVPQV